MVYSIDSQVQPLTVLVENTVTLHVMRYKVVNISF
jgi:hypothetical protein